MQDNAKQAGGGGSKETSSVPNDDSEMDNQLSLTIKMVDGKVRRIPVPPEETVLSKGLLASMLEKGDIHSDRIESIDIPRGVTELGDTVFKRFSLLRSVVIPDGVTRIGHDCFTFSRLRSLVIPASVTDIGSHAFMSCRVLECIAILGHVTMDMVPFAVCGPLAFILVPEKLAIDRAAIGIQDHTEVVRFDPAATDCALTEKFDYLKNLYSRLCLVLARLMTDEGVLDQEILDQGIRVLQSMFSLAFFDKKNESSSALALSLFEPPSSLEPLSSADKSQEPVSGSKNAL